MFDFIFWAIIWTFAMYGFIEVIKTIYYICTYDKNEDNKLNLVVIAKNQAEHIESFCRSILFRYFAEKKDYVGNIIFVDLDSEDETKEILNKIAKDYKSIQVKEWEECKRHFDVMESK